MTCLSAATRRELLLALICGASARTRAVESLSPNAFPWAVDKGAHLARRQVFSRGTGPNDDRGVLLHQLHLALERYWLTPDSEIALIHARQRLLSVKSATQALGMPANWREVHDFAAILLDAADWHRCV